MSEKILQLVSAAPPEVDEGLVDRLEKMLDLAQTGQLQSLVAVGALINGEMLTSTGPSPDLWADIGALEIVKSRLIADNVC